MPQDNPLLKALNLKSKQDEKGFKPIQSVSGNPLLDVLDIQKDIFKPEVPKTITTPKQVEKVMEEVREKYDVSF